ncbi:MAG: alpha/beta hydrolase [Candidatus Zixiibacteriota bacterium]|nr:MAG: alpha/beta hydrolase [candidate division Zixibacteria bacterium]
MAKLSRQTKEIIKTVLFFLVLALLLFIYVIYPLNRSKAIMGRADVDDYNADSVVANDPTAYLEAGLPADTFRLESDGLTVLACLFVSPTGDFAVTPTGTAILVHGDTGNRDSLVALASILHDSGFAVYSYDQRAFERSTGKYRGDGTHEASDLEELVSHLEIRNLVTRPLYVVGYQLGADAALLAAQEEKRINAVVAVSPYLTTLRMQDALKERFDTYWFPFYRTIMWWWYEIRSGYATIYRRLEDIRAVSCRTLVLVPPDQVAGKEVTRLKEVSEPDFLDVRPLPADRNAIHDAIVEFLVSSRPD